MSLSSSVLFFFESSSASLSSFFRFFLCACTISDRSNTTLRLLGSPRSMQGSSSPRVIPPRVVDCHAQSNSGHLRHGYTAKARYLRSNVAGTTSSAAWDSTSRRQSDAHDRIDGRLDQNHISSDRPAHSHRHNLYLICGWFGANAMHASSCVVNVFN